jgi:hypothetical protein
VNPKVGSEMIGSEEKINGSDTMLGKGVPSKMRLLYYIGLCTYLGASPQKTIGEGVVLGAGDQTTSWAGLTVRAVALGNPSKP